MIHVVLSVKVRVFMRDIVKFRKEWHEDLGVPFPRTREIVHFSERGIGLTVWVD